ncbi:Mrp/NBP35 family ATP-binding protein [Phaeovulum vinaykumarii]|uniref:Iron-sulfur cluster carrier protein n=1 Tax=Phaeovulum vinaykumarii TaxID=407234 RepID=A0A1N7JTN0_9RHOB|nr:Mrp/NBP35 family ATP-binding protein [Phaeovulum vinaykumarii]SIS52703.1 ATP-binding protein involved in chromosome partitioning [Phaeovulum vinaykumarii]SOB91336.1 ATP-binding protein involved in chromosome partitioning [Phaeovulum vinaykumarii]
MSASRSDILAALSRIALPAGGDPVSRDLVRALGITEGGVVSFVLEAADAAEGRALEALRPEIEAALAQVPGVTRVSVVTTAAAPAAPAAAAAPAGKAAGPRIGGHPKPAPAQPVPGVARILAVASGKGGVGKSTVSANLAVALARQGRRVALLDADIHGPSQPMMMGVNRRPASPDGETLEPVEAHGVAMMSLGLMLDPDAAVIWRGPMLMGAMQQMMFQVNWGERDVMIIDLPPGTGDVQLSMAQKTRVDGALVVSTPQDVALIDARRAIDMFARLRVPVLGLIENMSVFVCPHCGGESHPFGHGGVAAEAQKMGVPLLAEVPLALEVRTAGDAGRPIAADEGPIAEAYAALARGLIAGGMA